MKNYIIIKGKKIKYITILICIFIFLIPFDTFRIYSNFSLVKFYSIFIIIFSLLYQKKNKIKFNKIIITLSIFSIYILVQLLYTLYFSAVISSLITIFMYILLIYLLYQIEYTELEKKLIIHSLCYMSLFCIILTFFFGYNFEGRLTIKFPNMICEDPNQFGGYIIFGLIYFVYQFFNCKKRKLFNIVMISFHIYYLLLTGSRGALIAGIIGTSLIVLLNSINSIFIRKNLRVILYIILIIYIINIIINILPVNMIQRINIIDAINSGGTGRRDIWRYYLNYYSESTVFYKMFGYGYGSLSLLYRKVAHNTWIELLISTGFFGLLIYVYFFIQILKNFIKSKNILMIGIFSSIIILTMSLSLLNYKPIWIIIFISMICTCNQNKNKNMIINNAK